MHALSGLTVAATLAAPLPTFAVGQTTRVSVASDGTQGNGNYPYVRCNISADGRYVVFNSDADDLVPGDSNGQIDVFIRDRLNGRTSRVSVASDGTQGNHSSFNYRPATSIDGRYVAFASFADNLVPGDTNEVADVFVHDRKTGQTSRISLASNGAQGNRDSGDSLALSADGRFVAFDSDADNLVSGDTNGVIDVFVRDRQTDRTTRVSLASDGKQGNSESYVPAISADGRYVAFISSADNLVPGDTNEEWDVFVHDRIADRTTRIGATTEGSTLEISADGRYVVFSSSANNLVPGDTNGAADIFVHDRNTGQTHRMSVTSDGTQGNRDSGIPAISADGRYVAFQSWANNLVPGDSNGVADIFLRDRKTGLTDRVSVSSNGAQGNDWAFVAAISADGRSVAFSSNADNLVPDDSNGSFDIFLRDRLLLPGKQADLAVTQTESGDPVAKGSLLSYTVKVRNNGNDAAAGVNLTDLVPLNAELLSVTPSQGSCYRAPISVCRLGTVAPGAQAKVYVKLKANQKGVLRNRVSVNGPPRDTMQGNNSSVISTRVQ